MASVRIIALYPNPTDIKTFETRYTEHLSWAPRKVAGLTKLMVGKVMGTPSGDPAPFYRIAELYFPSIEVLQDTLKSPGTQEAVADAVALSTGGTPTFLIAEEEQPVRF